MVKVCAGQASSRDWIVPSPSVSDDALPIRNEDLPPVPEEEDEELLPAQEGVDSVWSVRPGIFDGDDSDGDGGVDEELLPDAVPSRRRTVTVLLLLTETSDQERKCRSRSPREGHR